MFNQSFNGLSQSDTFVLALVVMTINSPGSTASFTAFVRQRMINTAEGESMREPQITGEILSQVDRSA